MVALQVRFGDLEGPLTPRCRSRGRKEGAEKAVRKAHPPRHQKGRQMISNLDPNLMFFQAPGLRLARNEARSSILDMFTTF